MTADLRSTLKNHGLSIYTDVGALAGGMRQRLPFAAARRRAQYVLIDLKRVPLGQGEGSLSPVHLGGIRVLDGLGYTRQDVRGPLTRLQAPPMAQPSNPAGDVQARFLRGPWRPSQPRS